MPKDWLKYKAEVHRLYIVEEKTVYQVRDILKARHGFCASVRAYRMHFDEWGMKKYKATRARSHTSSSRHLSSPPSTRVSSTPTDASTSTFASTPSTSDVRMGDIRGESEPIIGTRGPPSPSPRLSDLLRTIEPSWTNPLQILEAILHNWQSTVEYANTLIFYFQDPNFSKWVAQSPGPEIPAIFKLIENNVPPSDRFALMKALLEADLSTRPDLDHYPTPFQDSWYQACDIGEWEDARDFLYDGEVILSRISGVFPECALVVLAERLLEKYSRELEHWAGRPLHEDEREAKNECTKRYGDILNFFDHAKEDVRADFYRFLLRFDLDDSSHGYARKGRYEDVYRLKYIQLSSSRSRPAWEVSRLEHSRSGSDAQQRTAEELPPTPPFSDDAKSGSHPSIISSNKVLEALYEKWRSLDGFLEYTSTLIAYDGNGVNLFAPPADDQSQNIFDLLVQKVTDEAERIALAKSILIASSAARPTTSRSTSWLLEWWLTVYPSTPSSPSIITYHNFNTQLLHNPPLDTQINAAIASVPGQKLFLDAVIALVGERLLRKLKNGLRRGSEMGGRNLERKRGYAGIVSVLRERGLKVDESWMGYLLDSMSAASANLS